MQAVQRLKSPSEARPRWRLNGRLIVALVFDVVAWGLIIAALWSGLKLLHLL